MTRTYRAATGYEWAGWRSKFHPHMHCQWWHQTERTDYSLQIGFYIRPAKIEITKGDETIYPGVSSKDAYQLIKRLCPSEGLVAFVDYCFDRKIYGYDVEKQASLDLIWEKLKIQLKELENGN